MAALNLPIAPAIVPSTFRRALHSAATKNLTGPVTDLFSHLLRHACATHNYERGMTLWEVQKVLGHDWATTTLRYMNPRELHQAGEKSQAVRPRRRVEGLRHYYELAS